MRYMAGVLTTLALATLACGRPEPVTEAPTDGVAVRMTTVVATERPERLEVVGTVTARNTAVVASRVFGYVREIRVVEGERVNRGALLVRLDDGELAAVLAQAEAGVAEVSDAIVEATQGREAARAELDLAEATHRRFDELAASESVSRQELDEVTARLLAVRAELEVAEARVRRASAQRARAEAQRAAARTALGYAQITAPTDGLVTARHLDPGSLATPGTPILTLEAAGPLELEVAIPAARRVAVAVGQEVDVSLDGLAAAGADGPMIGRVSDVVHAIDPATRTFTAKIELPASPGLRSGMFGRALLDGPATRVLEVPAAAVVEHGQLQWVFVVEESTARQRLVTLGERRDDRYPVLSGLRDGERVVVEPGALQDGAAVREREP